MYVNSALPQSPIRRGPCQYMCPIFSDLTLLSPISTNPPSPIDVGEVGVTHPHTIISSLVQNILDTAGPGDLIFSF